jgi:hypothetical protein
MRSGLPSAIVIRLALVAVLAGQRGVMAQQSSWRGPDGIRPQDARVTRATALLPSRVSVPIDVVDIAWLPRRFRARLERSCTFVLVGVARIYVNDRCAIYRRDQSSALDVIKLAALFRHEETHLYGGGEAEARAVEAATFRDLLRKAPANLQTAGMLYAAELDRLVHSLPATRPGMEEP